MNHAWPQGIINNLRKLAESIGSHMFRVKSDEAYVQFLAFKRRSIFKANAYWRQLRAAKRIILHSSEWWAKLTIKAALFDSTPTQKPH